MADLEKLRSDYEKAEADLFKIDGEYTEKATALRDRYRPRLNKAGEKAAALQKELSDAEAAHALAERDIPDDERTRIADSLGLTLP